MSFFDNAKHSKFVKHAEKQENISRFVGFYLDRLSAMEAPTAEHRTISLLARSPASPVARAVLEAVRDCQALAVRFEIIFCRMEPAELVASWLDVAARTQETGRVAEIRWARHPALCDAHEQMGLGANSCWLGDSMRRDPETRDAFETFETLDADKTRRADRAFKCLWSKSDAVKLSLPTRLASSIGQLPSDVLNLVPSGTLPGTPVPGLNTRH